MSEKPTELTNHLLAEILDEQRKTRSAIVSLAEAIAGIRSKVESGEIAPPEDNDPPFVPDPPAPQPEPQPSVSVEQLRAAFAKASRNGHKAALKDLLASHGAEKLPQLSEEQRVSVMAEVEAMLA